MAERVLMSDLIIICTAFISFSHFLFVFSSQYNWREEFYEGLPIDHFSYTADAENNTFSMRYLINDTWWDPETGPILYYPGNEGLVTEFAQNTGIMWDWAPELRAMLLFTEHRYYGKSLPYGNQSRLVTNLRHLSVDQVMADYATMLTWLRENVTGADKSAIIAIGGSYGGMLAAWMRVKYPHIVAGALASSAPILQLPGGAAPCSSFATIATRTFATSGTNCDQAVKKAWPMFVQKGKSTGGLEWLTEHFHLCNNSRLVNWEGLDELLYMIADAWRYMAMLDYPYPANLIQPLPAWPVKEACKYLTDPSGEHDNDTFLLNVQKAANIFYNHTGTTKCLDLKSQVIGNFDLTTWSFQACTELTFRRCHNASDMFRPYSWQEGWFSEACEKRFGVHPRYKWLTMNYGVDRLKYATNIIFSSGDLDPWSGSDITKQSLRGAAPSLVVINIPNAAHHYDIRASNPSDTPEVINARAQMQSIIQGWIEENTRAHATPAAIVEKPSTKAQKIEY